MSDTVRPPVCKLCQTNFPRKVLRNLHFDNESLVVEIQGEGFTFARVVFSQLIGFRVLDERELVEFWRDYNETQGWLWEVVQGGWVELESRRPMFSAPSFFKGLKEYLIADLYSINVLTMKPFAIIEAGAEADCDE